jgi:hypothetical protein
MRTLASVGRTCARVLLGLFVVGQLFYLLLANFLGLEEPVRKALVKRPGAEALAPDYLTGKDAVHKALAEAQRWTTRWSQLTNQPQSWRLFAPNVVDTIPFVAVELRWDENRLPLVPARRQLAPLAGSHPFDTAVLAAAAQLPPPAPAAEPQLLLSENEPADVYHYVKLGRFRLRRYEAVFDCLGAATERPFRADSDIWADGIRDVIREEHGSIHAYLRWRLGQFLREHPDLPMPTQVILYVRIYRIPPPPGPEPWRWQSLGQHRVARWLPGGRHDSRYLPIEVYNPRVDRFEAMEQ